MTSNNDNTPNSSNKDNTPNRLTLAIIRAAVSGAVRAAVAWLLETFTDSQ